MKAVDVVKKIAAAADGIALRMSAAYEMALRGCPVKVIKTAVNREGCVRAGIVLQEGGEALAPAVVPEGWPYPCANLPDTAEGAANALVLAAKQLGKMCRAALDHAALTLAEGEHLVLWRLWWPNEIIVSAEGDRLKVMDCYAVACLTDEQERALVESEAKLCP